MNIKNQNEFYNYISNSVGYYIRANGKTYKDLAVELDVSEQFIKQVQSSSSTKHYNAYHLYRLSLILKVSIDSFFPSTFDEYIKLYPNSSKINFNILLQQIKGDQYND